MTTPSKAEAARINGAKSRGPKTDEGRRAVSLNAIKHGLSAQTVDLPNESEEELRDYLDHFAPANKPEADLVRQLASAHWRLVRYAGIETALLDLEMQKKREYVDKAWKNIDQHGRLALAFQSLAGDHSQLALLNRYQARLHHEYQRILKSLLQMQASRAATEAKLQNEPKQPAPNAPAPPPTPLDDRPLTHISESDITRIDYEGKRSPVPPSRAGDPAHPLGLGG
jgi:hypothetical protein